MLSSHMIQEEGHRGDWDQRCSCLLAQRDKDDGCYDVSSRREPLGCIACRSGKVPLLRRCSLKPRFCSSFMFENETVVLFSTLYTYQQVICKCPLFIFIVFLVLLHYYDYFTYFTKDTVIANTPFIYFIIIMQLFYILHSICFQLIILNYIIIFVKQLNY